MRVLIYITLRCCSGADDGCQPEGRESEDLKRVSGMYKNGHPCTCRKLVQEHSQVLAVHLPGVGPIPFEVSL